MAQKHVLIVDDDTGFRMLLRKVLEGAGYKVSEAKNAIEVFSAPPADLIVLDIQMPGISGIRVLESFKSDTGFKGKILVLTALTDSEHARQAREGGTDGFMLKPVPKEKLLAQVQDLIGPA
jgi:CheY-like chemotaxis protein